MENSGNPPEPDDQPVDLYRENEELKVNNFLFFCFLYFVCCVAVRPLAQGDPVHIFLLFFFF